MALADVGSGDTWSCDTSLISKTDANKKNPSSWNNFQTVNGKVSQSTAGGFRSKKIKEICLYSRSEFWLTGEKSKSEVSEGHIPVFNNTGHEAVTLLPVFHLIPGMSDSVLFEWHGRPCE